MIQNKIQQTVFRMQTDHYIGASKKDMFCSLRTNLQLKQCNYMMHVMNPVSQPRLHLCSLSWCDSVLTKHCFTADRHRPYLMTRVQGTNDYINAVFLDVSTFP